MIKKLPEYPIRYSGCLKKHKDGDVAGITSTTPRQPKQNYPALATPPLSREPADCTTARNKNAIPLQKCEAPDLSRLPTQTWRSDRHGLSNYDALPPL